MSGGCPSKDAKCWRRLRLEKARGQELEEQEGAPESLHLGIGEAKCGGALGCYLHWTIDFLKGFFGEDAIVADALYLKQSSIGLKADAP
jgi:hypothetical protein